MGKTESLDAKAWQNPPKKEVKKKLKDLSKPPCGKKFYVMLNSSGNMCLITNDLGHENHITTSFKKARQSQRMIQKLWPEVKYRLYELKEIK